MTCAIPNRDEVISAIEKKETFYETSSFQTADDTRGFLQNTQEHISKIDDIYGVEGTNARLKTTITTEISKDFNKDNFEQSQLDYWQKLAELGTFVHSTNEIIMKNVVNQFVGMTAIQMKEHIHSIDNEVLMNNILRNVSRDFLITKEDLLKTIDGAKDILLQAVRKQIEINKKTGLEGIPSFHIEQKIIDPKKDIGGTADLIVIYSNNTASVFDFKTKRASKNKGQVDRDGNLATRNVFTETNLNKYKLQLAEITRILLERYGVKTVTTKRIVPIQVDIKYDKINGWTNKISKINYGIKQNKFLGQIAPLPESTGFEDLDHYIRTIDERIDKLEQQGNHDWTKKKANHDKIVELRNSREDLLIKHDLSGTIAHVNKLMLELDDLSRFSIEDLRNNLLELKALATVTQSTYDYRKTLKERGFEDKTNDIETKIKEIFIEVSDKIKDVEEELYNKRLNELTNKATGYALYDEEGKLMPFEQESYFGKIFNQLSEFNNPIFKLFRSRLDDVNYDMRAKLDSVISDVQNKEDAVYAWMKKNGKDANRFVPDTFVDKKTGNLVNELSEDFRKGLKKIRGVGQIDQILSTFNIKQSYQEYYEKQRQIKKEYFDRIYPSDRAKANSSLQEWVKNHSLEIVNGKAKYPLAWYNAYKENRLEIKPEVKAANLSNEYKYIASIPVLLDYYKMFTSYNNQFRKTLGVEYKKLPATFIPNIRKNMMERITSSDGLLEGINKSWKEMVSDMSIREDDMEFGGAEKKIPRFFLNPLMGDKAKSIEDKSYQLGKSLILFAKMAYNYEAMSSIEAEVLTMQDFIQDKAEQIVRKGPKALKNSLIGEKITEKLGEDDIRDVFGTFRDMYIYGQSIKPTLGNKDGKYEKIILKAKQYFTLKTLGFGFIPAIGGYVSARSQAAIEGFKGEIYTREQYLKAVSLLSSEDRKKTLALYAFTDPLGVLHEHEFSVTKGEPHRHWGDPTERNTIAKYINARGLMRAFSYGDEHIDEVILTAMAHNYYVDNNGDFRRFNNKEEEERFKDRSIWSLFEYKDGEAKLNLNDAQKKNAIIKFRRAVQAGQSKIKGVIPSEDKAAWQNSIIMNVVMQFKSWLPGVLKERVGALKYNDSLDAITMGRFTAFGFELANNDKKAMYSYLKDVLAPKLGELGKAVFGLTKYGRRNNKVAYLNYLENNPGMRGRFTYEAFQDAQKRQLKGLVMELRMLLLMGTILCALGGDWDDDGIPEYREHYALRKLAAIMSKASGEMIFYYNPNEAISMVKNPIPLIGVAADVAKAIGNTIDETFDLTVGEQTGIPLLHKAEAKDKTPIMYYTPRFIPGINALEKVFEIFGEDKSMTTNYNR